MIFDTFNSNRTDATSGAGNALFSGEPEFTPFLINRVRVAQSFVFCVVYS